MNIEQLREHMHLYRDAVILLGPEAVKGLSQFSTGASRAAECITVENYNRDPHGFWQYYQREVFRSPEEHSPSLAQVLALRLLNLGLASAVVDLNYDGLLPLDGNTGIFLKGNGLLYRCVSAACQDIVYLWQVVFPGDGEVHNTCELCGHLLKPDIKMIGEEYDEDKYKVVKHLLEKTHTLITVGLDYKETAILELLEDFGNEKGLCALNMATGRGDERKVLIGMAEDSAPVHYNDITSHEFFATGEVDESFRRLVKALDVHGRSEGRPI